MTDSTRAERRALRAARRAWRATDKAERLAYRLPKPQTAPAQAAAIPSPPGATRRGLVVRFRGAIARRAITRVLAGDRVAEVAVVVAGVALGIVLAAVALGAMLAHHQAGEDW